MPILVECSSCKRKLRVQDHLLGKMVKCPNCQVKFQAQIVAEPEAALAVQEAPPASSGEVTTRTPMLGVPEPQAPALEIADPASSPSAQPGKPRSGERISATPLPAANKAIDPGPAAVDAPPQPFATPFLRVLAVFAAMVVLAAMVGCGLGWWIGAAVEKAAATAGARATGKSP